MSQYNKLLDHKKTGWAKHKKVRCVKKLYESINWADQTQSWVGYCPAGPPVVPSLPIFIIVSLKYDLLGYLRYQVCIYDLVYYLHRAKSAFITILYYFNKVFYLY